MPRPTANFWRLLRLWNNRPPGPSATACTPACAMLSKTLSISPSERSSKGRTVRPSVAAAACPSLRYCAADGSAGLNSKPTRDNCGTISRRSSNRFAVRSVARMDSPVMFPPGRARLSTNFNPTGSATKRKTMGIVVVAFLA